jgi:hypothetical protein
LHFPDVSPQRFDAKISAVAMCSSPSGGPPLDSFDPEVDTCHAISLVPFAMCIICTTL